MSEVLLNVLDQVQQLKVVVEAWAALAEVETRSHLPTLHPARRSSPNSISP